MDEVVKEQEMQVGVDGQGIKQKNWLHLQAICTCTASPSTSFSRVFRVTFQYFALFQPPPAVSNFRKCTRHDVFSTIPWPMSS